MSERREREDMTAFTIRRIRNELIEKCAIAVEGESLELDTNQSDDIIYNKAIRDAADAVRALKDE